MKPIRIAHTADIHIKDKHREDDLKVFETFYALLRKASPDIIVVAGDVFDSKTRASGNNIQDVSHFLRALTTIAPVVMIPGNHDTNVREKDSMDLLTPVVEALALPNLTYLRTAGVYAAHGLAWGVFAPDDPVKIDAATMDAGCAYLEKEGELKEGAPRIALFHEELGGALYETGMQIRDAHLQVADLAHFDATLGGHIHRCQGGKRWRYPGSLIQQNIGESHRGHGFLIWEITPSNAHSPFRTALPTITHIEVPNNRGYLHVDLVDGNVATPEPFPAAPYWYDVRYDSGTTRDQALQAAADMQARYGVKPRTVEPRTGAPTPEAQPSVLKVAQESAATLETQLELIREHLRGTPHVGAVVALHKQYYRQQAYGQRAAIRLLTLELDNVYSFGPGTRVDFKRMEGQLSGIHAENGAGKSNLIDALLYALYNVFPRSGRKGLTRRGASGFRVRLEFECEGKRGVIEKRGTASGANTTSNYTFEYGETQTKGAADVVAAEIGRVVGTYRGAQLTAVSQQCPHVGGSFTNMTVMQRKETLSYLLSLGSFKDIEKVVKLEQKGLAAVCKEHERAGPFRIEQLEEARDALYAATEELALDEANQEEQLASLQERLGAANKAIGAATARVQAAKRVLGISPSENPKYDYKTYAPASVQAAEAELKGLPAHPTEDEETPLPTAAELAALRLALGPSVPEGFCATSVGGGMGGQPKAVPPAGGAVRQPGVVPPACVTPVPSPEEVEAARAVPATGSSPWPEAAPGVCPTLTQIAAAKKLAVSPTHTKSLAARLAQQINAAKTKQAVQQHLSELKASLRPGCPGCTATAALFRSEPPSDALAALKELNAAVQTLRAAAHRWREDKDKHAAAQQVLAAHAYWDHRARATRLARLENRRAWHIRSQLQMVAQQAAYREYTHAQVELQRQTTRLAAAEKAVEEQSRLRAETSRQKAEQLVQLRQKEVELKHEQERVAAHAATEGKLEEHRAYLSVLKPKGGISDILLSRTRALLETELSTQLTRLGSKIEARLDADYKIHLKVPNGEVELEQSNGDYRSFVIDQACRIALGRVAAVPVLDCLIIDEGFGSCDEKNLDSMVGYLGELAGQPDAPRLILAVSHVPQLNDALQKPIRIAKTATGSVAKNSD